MDQMEKNEEERVLVIIYDEYGNKNTIDERRKQDINVPNERRKNNGY